MKYQIREIATYTIEAESAQEAINKFLGPEGIKCPFPTEVEDRSVYDEQGNWCETSDEL